MQLTRSDADVYAPDGAAVDRALSRTTHLAVGAHQDDLEFMALHGILECFSGADRWFTGVTVTDGSGSPRSGPYAGHSDRQMQETRVEEQRQAARLGRYGCQIQLMYPSATVKNPAEPGPANDIAAILDASRPDIVYLHNPADKHDTHVACCLRTVAALRRLPEDSRPSRVYGCEIWRDLDWLADADKQVLPLDDPDGLGQRLAAVFDSQIAGGKRYDLAVQGRRLAHATFLESHAVDRSPLVSFAIDLLPLIADPALDVAAFTGRLIRRLQDDVEARIARLQRSR